MLISPERSYLTAYKSDTSFYEDEVPKKVETLYDKMTLNGNKNVNDFFDAKIFGNKNFYEIIDQITDIEA